MKKGFKPVWNVQRNVNGHYSISVCSADPNTEEFFEFNEFMGEQEGAD